MQGTVPTVHGDVEMVRLRIAFVSPFPSSRRGPCPLPVSGYYPSSSSSTHQLYLTTLVCARSNALHGCGCSSQVSPGRGPMVAVVSASSCAASARLIRFAVRAVSLRAVRAVSPRAVRPVPGAPSAPSPARLPRRLHAPSSPPPRALRAVSGAPSAPSPRALRAPSARPPRRAVSARPPRRLRAPTAPSSRPPRPPCPHAPAPFSHPRL